MHLLTIDPGLRGCGVAIFDEETKELLRAAYVKGSAEGEMAEAWAEMAAAVDDWTNEAVKIVIEFPKVRQRSSQRAAKRGTDPNDLLQLAAVVGAITSCVKSEGIPIVHLPEEWKGQVPKKIHNDRAEARLSDVERARLPKLAQNIRHNMIDAIAIGLHEVGRLG